VSTTKKETQLEAMRGIAATIVLADHCLFAFFPGLVSVAQGSSFFSFVNGRAPVTVFFVLSGFVLTRRYLQTGDDSIITRGVIKRWPRLMGPVLIAVLASWALFQLNWYSFAEAGRVLGNDWLAGVAIPETNPTFIRALTQGTFLTFFRGDATFDNPLWTMHIEFVGSFIAFGLAMIIVRLDDVMSRVLVLLIVSVLCHFANANLVAFPIGVALATFIRSIAIPLWAALASTFLAIYLLGYTGLNVGVYSIFDLHPLIGAYWFYPTVLGAAILIGTIETSRGFRKVLDNFVMRILGEFSFPLYVLHLLVICSIGTSFFLSTRSTTGAALVSFIISFLTAWPLVILNRRWVAFLNQMINSRIKGPESRTRRPSLPQFS
jgi:peptidoglycan/LPS O-acetylase OafA/YrhL